MKFFWTFQLLEVRKKREKLQNEEQFFFFLGEILQLGKKIRK
jgi:hypothetical protein